MTAKPLDSIIHATDFSPAGLHAFAHALRIAVATGGLLHILHIGKEDAPTEWGRFPRARELLAQWGMIAPGASPKVVAEQLDLKILKTEVESVDPAHGVSSYVNRHNCGLLVLTTHDQGGLRRWLQGSVAETAARDSHAPTLFLREGQRGFIDADSGAVLLRTILLPIDPGVAPMRAWRLTADLAHALEPSVEIRLLHIGEDTVAFQGLLPHVETRQGPVVDTILAYQKEIGADLIVMPTAGRHGIFDALRGSTTQRVLHEANCPVLAVPAN